MPEKCPLTNGDYFGMAVDDLPEACMRQCEPLWSRAILTNNVYGEYDIYDPEPHVDDWSPCDHRNTDLAYSHESLQASEGSAQRIYSIVDLCMGEDCGAEYGEQSYQFTCPNN